jgi:Ca2+-transporting ATPase
MLIWNSSATDAPTEKILNRKPVPKSAPLFTPTMWKMIIGQSIYQLVVTFTLHFAGARILDYDMTDTAKVAQLRTIVFNTFVWMQIFNEFNNRRLDNNFNIFEGMLKNYWFMGINCIMVGGQIMIIFVGGEAIRVVRLDPTQWGICLLCAIFCVPWAVVLRCIPDRYAVIAIDVVSKVFMVVWTPFAKSVKFVFSPVTKTFRAIGRVSKRTTRKVFKKGKTSDDSETKQNVDEEAQLPEAKDEKSANSSAPPDLPPITLTAPNTPHMVGACGV